MRFDIVTLFPEMFPGYLSQSLLHKAIERQLVQVVIHDLRDWAKDKHKSVDDRPFGGGPGMVIKVEPVVEGIEAIRSRGGDAGHLVLLSPQGERLSQRVVERLAQHQRLLLLCGRYEGFDERVKEILKPEEISVGDYVLNGGEVAAMVLIDTVIRMVTGVLGDERSAQEDSFSSGNRLLEFAQYTRPREYRGHQVPEVLLSGNHEEIARWRQQQSIEKTAARRADLFVNQTGSETDESN